MRHSYAKPQPEGGQRACNHGHRIWSDSCHGGYGDARAGGEAGAPQAESHLGAEDLAAFFTDDAVYHNIPFEPVTGRENIADNIASFIRPGPPGIERIEFRVINIAASGPVVMTERVDVFTLAGKTFDLQVMGAFEVNDGKIKAWRDYFDPSQFNRQKPQD